MTLIELRRHAGLGELRLFGFVWLPLALVLLASWSGSRVGLGVAILAAIAAFCMALVQPLWLRPLYVGWMALSFPLAWLTSHVVLAAVFFLLITPIGLVLRMVRRDPLARAFDREAQSYWTPRRPDSDPQRSLRQY